jgi:hypothetical protein
VELLKPLIGRQIAVAPGSRSAHDILLGDQIRVAGLARH